MAEHARPSTPATHSASQAVGAARGGQAAGRVSTPQPDSNRRRCRRRSDGGEDGRLQAGPGGVVRPAADQVEGVDHVGAEGGDPGRPDLRARLVQRAGRPGRAARRRRRPATPAAPRRWPPRGARPPGAPPRPPGAASARADRSRWVTETSPPTARRRSARSATGSGAEAVAGLHPALAPGPGRRPSEASAASTSSRCRARQPATVASRPRRSAAATDTRSLGQVDHRQRPGQQRRVRGRRCGQYAGVQRGADPARPVRRRAGPSSPTRPPARWPRASARARACSRSRVAGVADRLGDRGDGDRVGQVAAGGHVGQQQVQPDQRADQRRPRSAGRPIRVAIARGDRRADAAVVDRAAPCRCRAGDAPSSSRSGPLHLAGVPAGLVGRLHQVPVEGVAVHRVVLRQAAQPGPLGQPAVDQPVPVAGLPGGHQAGTGAEQGDQRGAGLRAARARAAAGSTRPATRRWPGRSAARWWPPRRPPAARGSGRVGPRSRYGPAPARRRARRRRGPPGGGGGRAVAAPAAGRSAAGRRPARRRRGRG